MKQNSALDKIILSTLTVQEDGLNLLLDSGIEFNWLRPIFVQKTADFFTLHPYKKNKSFKDLERIITHYESLGVTPFSAYDTSQSWFEKCCGENWWAFLAEWERRGAITLKDIHKKMNPDLDQSLGQIILNDNSFKTLCYCAEAYFSNPSDFLKPFVDFRNEWRWVSLPSHQWEKFRSSSFDSSDLYRLLSSRYSNQNVVVDLLVYQENKESEQFYKSLKLEDIQAAFKGREESVWNFVKLSLSKQKKPTDLNPLSPFLSSLIAVFSEEQQKKIFLSAPKDENFRWKYMLLNPLKEAFLHRAQENPTVENITWYVLARSNLRGIFSDNTSLWRNVDWQNLPEINGADFHQMEEARAWAIGNACSFYSKEDWVKNIDGVFRSIDSLVSPSSYSILLNEIWMGIHKESNEEVRSFLAQTLWHGILTSPFTVQNPWLTKYNQTQHHIDKNPRLQIKYIFPRQDLFENTIQKANLGKGPKGKFKKSLPDPLRQKILIDLTVFQSGNESSRPKRKM